MIALFLIVLNVSVVNFEIGDKLYKSDLSEVTFIDIQDFKIKEGHIYITDFRGISVYLFDNKGNLIGESGREGRGPGEFVHGPRNITPAGDKVYVIGMMPYFFIYDDKLNFERNEEFIRNPMNTYNLYFNDGNLIMSLSQFFEETVIIYNIEKGTIERHYLDFTLQPGLLSQFTMLPIGDNWLFKWRFQNKFKLYDKYFNHIRTFSIDGVQKKADGQIRNVSRLPDDVSTYRQKVYNLGSFMPAGDLFQSATVVGDDLFLLQFGTLTGGADNALIIDKKGEIIQKLELPHSGRVLGYCKTEEELYMINDHKSKIEVYQFFQK